MRSATHTPQSWTKHMKINWNKVTQHLVHQRSNNFEVDGSKENNDILVLSYIEISKYNITNIFLSKLYLYSIIKYEYVLK